MSSPVKITRKHMHHWCGPYALAYIGKISYEEALEVFRRIRGYRGRPDVEGVYNYEMSKALGLVLNRPVGNPTHAHRTVYRTNSWGERRPTDGYPTLTQWLKTRDKTATYLVNVTGHYVVITPKSLLDNQSMKKTPLKSAAHRRKRVRAYWRID